MKHEIEKVIELTGASYDQIKLNDEGYWSRVYIINNGELIVKFPKYDSVSYYNEAKFLDLINDMALSINMQKVKWLADDHRLIVISGVKGAPLSALKNLTIEQKQSIGNQIGTFLKQLHSLKPDFSGQNLDEELSEYVNLYDDCAEFYNKHFSKDEIAALDHLMYTYLPSERRKLGEDLVFSHADIWEPNILLDEKGVVGIIDCGNAGYYDEAADFMIEDDILREFVLSCYGASETLRKKVGIKYDMSVIAGPGLGITLWGEAVIIKKWIPVIRKVISAKLP